MDAEHSASLSFADGPKLELDELIEQLVDRARGVQHAQGRLRGLLRANEMVSGELGLDVVLRHIVQAGCALAGARYGALGVIAPNGALEEFIHVGIDDDVVREIGHLPEGKGLLGALITDPNPIRLPRIADDDRSSGFPLGHPPMDSFLGVPVRVRGEVFGNLYLTESVTGHFTAEDCELVRSLAVTAGNAISNARLYSESNLQQRWLGASAEISAQLISAGGEDPLRMIARRASEISEADLVTVALVTPEADKVVVEVAVGDGAESLLGQRFSLARTLAGSAIEGRVPLMLRSAAESPEQTNHVSCVFEPGPVMVIPLAGTGKVLGALTIARVAGRAAFSAADLSMAAGFAGQASVAIELAAARSDQQRMLLLEDRDRIARDLHDHVIQQLFAIGMSLESVAAIVGSDPAAAAAKLHERVADLDRTIRQIRTSIFELRGPLGGAVSGVRMKIMAVASELSAVLGFAPGVAFSGAVDLLLSAQLADDVVACVREALTNVAKHARASSVSVDISVASAEVTVTVTDNGIGVGIGVGGGDPNGANGGDPNGASGLLNLKARAEHRGGRFELVTGPTGGARLTWQAPIS